METGNLAELLAWRAANNGWYAEPAYYSPEPVTHGQIHDGVVRLGRVLRSSGISKGDRVLLCLPDSLDLVQLLLACLAQGIVAFIANPTLHPEDHAFYEQDAEPTLVITSNMLRDRFQRSRVLEARELLSAAARAEPAGYEPVSGDALAYATYTSGTTGTPRAALHRHADVLTFIDAMCRGALHLTSQDIGLSSARMYFAYGLGNSIWFPLASGSSAVINQSAVSPELAAELCGRFRASVLYGVPTFFARIIDTCSPESFRSLRCAVSAGEALDIDLATRVCEFFGGVPILDGLGSTEVGQTFVSNSVAQWRLGTLGKVLPPYEVQVIAPDGTVAESGVKGTLWVRGPSITPGYWNRPGELSLRDGDWLDTRDTVCIDSSGWITYCGRADDLVIVGGVNVNPREIERIIVDDDAVDEVAVVGLKDPTGPSVLQAFLVPSRGATVDQSVIAGIHQRLLSRLSPFKVPHRFAVVAQLPRTATGKLLRAELRTESPTEPIWQLSSEPLAPAADSGRAERAENLGTLSLTARLAALQQERYRLVADAVSSETAKMLGQSDPRSVNRDRAFTEMGFDSQMTVELRNRLAAATGLQLTDTVGWDYGSVSGLAQFLEVELSGLDKRLVASAPVAVDDPIVVVGMACRFPGGIDSAEALWDMVSSGSDVMGGFPTDRGWDLGELFDPDPDAVGKTYTRYGAFVSTAADFDAEFFGISAREARAIDPQQRLLLEVCWEALETAGIDPAALAGSDTGVFAGTWTQPYGDAGSDSAEGYALTGSATSVASGRVAYLLGLQGPAITIDTACSSSLVATHLACQSLRNGESSLALAGGVTIMTTPASFTEFARQRGLAADGRCKAFSAAADGTGWGEGAAVVVLARLSEAVRHHHPVLAVIAGSAINQDGASNGLTAPNGPAQQRVIAQAAANAGIGLDQVDVVEAHGTGTRLGDPIEAGALIATYGAARDPDHPLWLGSVKSNLGHTQAAAGAAGLIKMIAALHHDTLPPTLHVDQPSPHIDWSAGTLRLLTEPTPWPETDHPRTAAVSSFGISGTNAHVIVQQAPTLSPAPTPSPASTVALPVWPLSARTPTALAVQAQRLHQHLLAHPGLDLADVAYSLATTRTQHPYRAAITTPAAEDPRTQLLAGLQALHTGTAHPNLTQHHLAQSSGKLVFVLPGQGGQYPAMGAGLYAQHDVFARAVEDCDQALRPFTGWSVRDLICHEDAGPLLERVDVVQPVLFTMTVSLAQVLASYDIVPDAVIGHSQGEIAAAYIAGALSLEDAAKIAALRSTALTRLSGTGAMASVLLGAPDLAARLQNWGERLSIAAVNGPTHTIISGDPAAMDQFITTCNHDGIQIRRIAVDYASHSAHVEQLREHLLGELADLTPQPARIPLYSTVASARSDHPLDTTTMGADYWYRNLREPVHFADSVAALLAAGPHTFVELSPHPVLAPAITDTLAATKSQSVVIGTAHRDRPDLDVLTSALARLHTHGHSPTWNTVFPHAHTTPLPTYPFQHRRYWLAPTTSADVSAAGLDRPEHPLLGAVTHLADQDQIVISGRLSASTDSWLTGHRVHDTVVFPAAGFVDLLLCAGQYVDCPVIDELILHTPLVLAEHHPTDLQITVCPVNERAQRPVTVHSRTSQAEHRGSWVLHATATLSADQPAIPVVAPVPRVQTIDPVSFYDQLASGGLHYSGPFQGVVGIRYDPADPDAVYAEIALPADTDTTGYGIHPALLDAALHPLTTLDTDPDTDPSAPRLPFALTGISLHASTATRLHVHLTRTSPDTYTLHATDPAGAPVITITTVSLRALPDSGLPRRSTPTLGESLFDLDWPALPVQTFPDAGVSPAWTVVAADSHHLAPGLHHAPIHPDLTHPDLVEADLVIWTLPLPQTPDCDPLHRVHALTTHTLTQLRHWLARPDTLSTHLAVLTRYAVTTSAHDPAPDLAHAAVWALIHTAQNEHPGRITLIDTVPTSNDTALINILATLGHTRTEPQLALRHNNTHTPRLTPASCLTPPQDPTVWDPEGTVLITGGTGMLGAVFAEHLITGYGVRHLLLVSRRGPDAPGATELAQRLTGLGAQVTITACDTGSVAELAAVLASIPDQHRLSAVVHAAGVLDDAVLTELSSAQLDTVLAAKADGAWHLHQLTAGYDLAAFVLFSSVAATLGITGQANYAAANAVLDALARHRRGATSLAWGYWDTPSGMTAHLGEVDQARITRAGLAPITTADGLALFDAALSLQRPRLVLAPVNRRALARLARANTLPAILSALTSIRPQAASWAGPQALATRLAAQTPDQQRATLTALVLTTTASVLAHPDPASLDPDRLFKDLGIDSLTALELRNVLTQHAGLALPPTLIFDHPTPNALSTHLIDLLAGGRAPSETTINDDTELRNLMLSIPIARLREAGLLLPLLNLRDSRITEARDESEHLTVESIDEMDLELLVKHYRLGSDGNRILEWDGSES